MWNNNLRLFASGRDLKEFSCDWKFYKICWSSVHRDAISNTPLRDWWISYSVILWESLQLRLRCILSGGRQSPTNLKETQRGTSKKRWLIATSKVTVFIFLPPFEGIFSSRSSKDVLWPENSHNSSLIHAGFKFHHCCSLADVESSKSPINLHFLWRNMNELGC